VENINIVMEKMPVIMQMNVNGIIANGINSEELNKGGVYGRG